MFLCKKESRLYVEWFKKEALMIRVGFYGDLGQNGLEVLIILRNLLFAVSLINNRQIQTDYFFRHSKSSKD